MGHLKKIETEGVHVQFENSNYFLKDTISMGLDR